MIYFFPNIETEPQLKPISPPDAQEGLQVVAPDKTNQPQSREALLAIDQLQQRLLPVLSGTFHDQYAAEKNKPALFFKGTQQIFHHSLW
jgi:hypothetical protein